MDKTRRYLPYLVLFVIVVFYYYFKLQYFIPRVFEWSLSDVDDAGRVLQVRAWLSGQGFYDLLNHRSNPPFGADMHWSRIGDVPLAATQLFLRLFFNNELAEKWGVLITPMWLCLIYAVLSGLVAKRLFKGQYAFAIGFAFVYFNEVLQSNFYPGRVDHHGLQLIFFMLCLYCVTFRDFKSGFISGACIAIGLAIGLEFVPLQVLIITYFTIIWFLYGDEYKAQLQGFVIGLGLFIIIGLLIDVAPQKIWVGANDRLSIATALPIIVGSIGLYIASFFRTDIIKRALLLVAVAIAVLLCAMQFPILLRPLYWQIDPKYYHFWMDDCADCKPLLTFPAFVQVKYGYFIIMGAVAVLVKMLLLLRAKANRDDVQKWSLMASLLFISLGLTLLFQGRLMAQSSAIAIITSAAIIAESFKSAKPVYAALIGFALFPPIADNLATFIKQIAPKSQQNITFASDFKCNSKPDFAHLAKMPKGLVAANLNIGTETLINTPHNVLATGFHRDLGRDNLYPIFLGTDDVAKARIDALGVNYVAFCQNSTEILRVKDAAPNGLIAHILVGKTPNYLRLIPAQNKTDIIAYEVIKKRQ